MDILKRVLYPIDGNGKLTIEDIVNEASGGGDGGSTTVDTLPGATATGKSLMKAASQEAARTAIGAGTSDFSGSYADLTSKPTIPAATTVDNLSGAGTTGKAVMKAANAEAARTAIGAGTGNSNLAIGTTASTAKAGNYQPTWEQVTSKPTVIGAGATQAAARQAIGAVSAEDIPSVPAAPTWSTLGGKPAVIAAGADQAAARTAIGAGTSNLAIGTTATTAMAGNTPIPAAVTWTNLSGKPATFPPTIGTTATTAKAGNYVPSAAEVAGVLPAALTSAQAAATPSIRALGTTATTALAGNTPLLAIGTTATTAKAGNWTPTIAQVTGLQAALDAKATAAALAALVTRVETLEAAAEG